MINAMNVTNENADRKKAMTTGGVSQNTNQDPEKIKVKNITSTFKVGAIQRMSNNLKSTLKQNTRDFRLAG